MDILANARICSEKEPRGETVKEMLENMGDILRELATEIAMISDAVYNGGNHREEKPTNEPRATPPMAVMIREQRDAAEYLLNEIVKIREVLW